MKLGVVSYRQYFSPEVFLSGHPRYQEDRSTCFLRVLKERLSGRGVSLIHCDDVSPDEAWGYLFINHNPRYVKKLKKKKFSGRLFLIVFESELIQPDNWLRQTWEQYDVVFSWGRHGESLRTKKGGAFVPFFWPNPFSLAQQPLPFKDRKKLCVLMAANKWKRRPKELYTERFRAIFWFMENHPEDFDLYGYSWNISPGKKIVEYIRNAFRVLRRKQTRPIDVSPVYRGTAAIKKEVLMHYRFCLCYENAEQIPGYITEKIFDCFIAGVVPVYLGWADAWRFLPKETYIDKRDFPTYDALYDHLIAMTEVEYNGYLKRIGCFLASEPAKRFDVNTFVDTLIKGMGLDSASYNGGAS